MLRLPRLLRLLCPSFWRILAEVCRRRPFAVPATPGSCAALRCQGGRSFVRCPYFAPDSTGTSASPARPPPIPPPRFFEDYKKNENKVVVVDEFLGREDAHRIIQEAMDLYQVGGCRWSES